MVSLTSSNGFSPSGNGTAKLSTAFTLLKIRAIRSSCLVFSRSSVRSRFKRERKFLGSWVQWMKFILCAKAAIRSGFQLMGKSDSSLDFHTKLPKTPVLAQSLEVLSAPTTAGAHSSTDALPRSRDISSANRTGRA